jgi:hypothetical protein
LATGPKHRNKKKKKNALLGSLGRACASCYRAARASSRVGREFAQAEMAIHTRNHTVFPFFFFQKQFYAYLIKFCTDFITFLCIIFVQR